MWEFDPPGVPIYRVTPNVFQLILKKYHHVLACMYFGYFLLSNRPGLGVICAIPIFGVIFGQNLGIWPPGVPICRITLHCFTINFEETLILCYECIKSGYFTLSNWSNCEVICITSIFGVIFGQNLAIWHPGVTIYRVNPHCCAINLEEMPSYSMENAVLWISSNVNVDKIMIIRKKITIF